MKNFNLSRECIGNITILSVIPANITLTNQGQSIPYEVDLADNVLYNSLISATRFTAITSNKSFTKQVNLSQAVIKNKPRFKPMD